MLWQWSFRGDKRALPLADRHYNRQKIGAPQFVPPGRCVVLITPALDALWVTSFPFAEYVHHAWAGAWVCSMFRNESEHLSSTLIREAVAVTRFVYGDAPPLGMITFVDTRHVRRKRDWGRCYRKAGFEQARCPIHAEKAEDCAACTGKTRAGLIALQLLPCAMPDPEPATYKMPRRV